MGGARRRAQKYAAHRLRFALDLGLAVSAALLLTVRSPGAMLVCWCVPSLITRVTGGYFAWLTHAPAGPQGSVNGSINNVNNWMGLFIFNQGYHQVHHCYPGIHWTDIPDRLDLMLQIDPQYIVPYWVTLHLGLAHSQLRVLPQSCVRRMVAGEVPGEARPPSGAALVVSALRVDLTAYAPMGPTAISWIRGRAISG